MDRRGVSILPQFQSPSSEDADFFWCLCLCSFILPTPSFTPSPSPAASSAFSIPSLLVILHFCAPFVSACATPPPQKVVWRLWHMQINVGSGSSVLGIMQIFSQYFLLFVVGFSFRFLNNTTTTRATTKNCCCYIGNILLSFNSSNSRLNF